MEDTQLAQTVVELIRSGNEGLPHELKWDVDVTNKEDQAEFIRDVMSLANADPHNSNDRYLVMNARKGEVNAEAASCRTDGAVFQDIVNERVSPRIKFSKHDSVPTELGEVTILVIENTYEFPYVARKDVGQIKKPLRKGDCWTRSGSQKRLATAEDYREMEGARGERRIRPSGLPNADALVASEPSEVGTTAEKALEAEKRSVLTRAIKRVAAETVQAWRSTENNKDEDYLEEMACKLTVGCDWLTVVARTAIEFEDQAALAECMSGLKAIYRLSAEEGLGHAGVAPVELSAWCPMLTAFPRVYIVGAFAIVHGCMRSVEIVCNVQVLRPSRVAPRPKLLVNDPLFDLLGGAARNHSMRFRSAIELAESN
ncbi:MAG: hypothetical protein KAW89_03805, partial [Armatimonadetes bacterium]|nr:hypothetical protein [Armatimonadota bacterium]